MALTREQRTVYEETSAEYSATLKDEDSAVIPLADLTTLTLTLYDERTAAIINSRTAQNVLNLNNVTVHATSGLVTWEIQPADNVIIDLTLRHGQSEPHVAQFDFTWDTGTKAGRHIVVLEVEQSLKIT